MTSLPKWRVTFVFGLLALALFGLVVKAARLQLVLGDDLRGLAENQYLRRVPVAAPRGAILDREGRPLAMSLPAWSVGVRPAQIEDKRAAAAALAKVLEVSEAEVSAKLASNTKFLWLKRRATSDVAEGVRALALPGVELKQEMRRTWPHKALAGQLLGLVDVDGRARGGIEQALDESLQGRSSTSPALADNKGDRIALAAGLDALDLELLEGDDVVLTVDASLQHEAEAAVAQAVSEHDAKAAWAIALDARTGAIRAVAHAPSYNPNAPDPKSARNKAFAEAFEPGSIFKIATFAAALDAGELRPDDRIFCENGRYELGKHVIHDTHKAEWLTATEVFTQSSNIGTLKIAQRVGEDRLKAAIAQYGFGARPGTTLVEETAGRVPTGRWGEARLATVSFGHGMLVSALQMASFVQAVANDGVRRTPYLVEEVRAPSGEVVRHAGARADDGGGERVMGAEAARTLTTIMKGVATGGGTGTLAAIPGIEVAGKTGTAEKVDPMTKRYSRDLNLSSFVGFAPAKDPRVVVIVVVDEPKGSHFGGIVAAPAWRRIVEHALVEDGVLATGALAALAARPASAVKPAVVAKSAEGGHIGRVGEGAAEASSSKGAEQAPDLRGLGARAALRRAEELGLELSVSGSGVVVAQTPAAGAPVAAGQRVKIVLAAVAAATPAGKVASAGGAQP
jgi:cell division protein FtsI (penicillin-binding protein 3)